MHEYTEYVGPEWSPNGKAILAGISGEAPQIAVADIESGNRFFLSQVWYGGIAWNDDSELLFDREGANTPFKVMFDWERNRGRGPASVRLFSFKQDGKFGYLNSNDENWEAAVKPQLTDAGHFSEGLAPVAIDGKWGYINETGELTIKPRFDAALAFSRGRARVNSNGRWRVIDKRGIYVRILTLSDIQTTRRIQRAHSQTNTSPNGKAIAALTGDGSRSLGHRVEEGRRDHMPLR